MGNGYTFELESLIFLSLTRAACDVFGVNSSDVSVYGDDIICPSDVVPLLIQVLNLVGFEVNHSKSFVAGPFRESCGKDWFLGELVRPLFIKKSVSNRALMGWCNHIFRLNPGLSDPRWKLLYDGLKDLVPLPFWRLDGPDGYGDGHFVCEYEDYTGCQAHSHTRRGWEGIGFHTLAQSPISDVHSDTAVYATGLYEAQSISPLFRTRKHAPRMLSGNAHVRKMFLSDYNSSAVKPPVSKKDKGLYLATERDRTRTTLKRMCRPWHKSAA